MEEEPGHNWIEKSKNLWSCTKCSQIIYTDTKPIRDKQIYTGKDSTGWYSCDDTIVHKVMTE